MCTVFTKTERGHLKTIDEESYSCIIECIASSAEDKHFIRRTEETGWLKPSKTLLHWENKKAQSRTS